MTEYEKMLDTANKNNIAVYENYDFSGTRIKGLYCDGFIALSKDLLTDSEKKCVLAEEIGHHLTSSGNILNMNTAVNRKQERHARMWAYRYALDLSDFITAYKNGCQNRYEIAEFLSVTEEFLLDAIESYKHQYGMYTKFDRYIIYFEPLGVLELNI